MERSLELYESTNGAFDVAIYPVMKAWGFTDGNYQVPDTDILKATLELADPSLIDYDKETSTVSFKKDGRWYCKGLYIIQDYGHLQGKRCNKRTGQLRRQCAGIWH